MNEDLTNHDPAELDDRKGVVDLSEDFLALSSIEFLDLLRAYRKKAVHLSISVPWSGSETMGIRLKAFLETRTELQKREATIRGTKEQRQAAVSMSNMANALNSGVKWEVVN